MVWAECNQVTARNQHGTCLIAFAHEQLHGGFDVAPDLADVLQPHIREPITEAFRLKLIRGRFIP